MTYAILLLACSQLSHDVTLDSDLLDTEVVEPPVAAFGDAETATLRVVASQTTDRPTDLAFRPDDLEQLWVSNQSTDSVTIVWGPESDAPEEEWRKDTFGNHFMEEVSSLAFGDATYRGELTFATCHESRNTYDDNYRPNDFMGPVLWPADLDVFAEVNQSQYGELAGSHLDMLHGSPDCMGIEHAQGNAYWVFDGFNGELVYYDFQVDHGPGADDHSDGIVRRYAEVELTRKEGIPSHMVLADDGWLYIADTGANQVLRVDTTVEGTARDLPLLNEPLEEHSEITDVPFEVFIDDIKRPSGLAFDNQGHLLVGLAKKNRVEAYDLATGELVDELPLDTQQLGGLAVHPDSGRLYVTDVLSAEVLEILPGE